MFSLARLPRVGRIEWAAIAFALGLLLALLAPLAAQEGAREKARQAQCINNLRQITTACMMYCQDNEEMMPPAWPNDKTSWTPPISPQIGNDKIFDCPSNNREGTPEAPDYGYNSLLSSVALSDVQNTSNMPVYADISSGAAFARAGKNYGIYDWNTDLDARHSGGVVMAFLDGHVAWHNSGKSPLESIFKAGFDPYDGVWQARYSRGYAAMTLTEKKRSSIEKAALPLGTSYGVRLNVSSDDWSTMQSVSMAVGSEAKLPLDRGSLYVSLADKQATAGAFGAPARLALADKLKAKSSYDVRAYCLRGKLTNKNARLYIVMRGPDGKTSVLSTAAAPGAASGLYCGARAEPARGKKMKLTVRRQEGYSFAIP